MKSGWLVVNAMLGIAPDGAARSVMSSSEKLPLFASSLV